MSTGNINLDILQNEIVNAGLSGAKIYKDKAIESIKSRYDLTDCFAEEIYNMILDSSKKESDKSELIVTAPTSFSINAKGTKNTVEKLIYEAEHEIIITGYSLSGYFEDLIDVLINKSKSGILVKFFANNLEGDTYEKLLMYKGTFLKIYNYNNTDDTMAALHAKVICVDRINTLITSANLSYHGQEGNIEVGTLNKSSALANQVNDFLTTLLFKKVFTEL